MIDAETLAVSIIVGAVTYAVVTILLNWWFWR
jgi:hypothetical protein